MTSSSKAGFFSWEAMKWKSLLPRRWVRPIEAQDGGSIETIVITFGELEPLEIVKRCRNCETLKPRWRLRLKSNSMRRASLAKRSSNVANTNISRGFMTG